MAGRNQQQQAQPNQQQLAHHQHQIVAPQQNRLEQQLLLYTQYEAYELQKMHHLLSLIIGGDVYPDRDNPRPGDVHTSTILPYEGVRPRLIVHSATTLNVRELAFSRVEGYLWAPNASVWEFIPNVVLASMHRNWRPIAWPGDMGADMIGLQAFFQTLLQRPYERLSEDFHLWNSIFHIVNPIPQFVTGITSAMPAAALGMYSCFGVVTRIEDIEALLFDNERNGEMFMHVIGRTYFRNITGVYCPLNEMPHPGACHALGCKLIAVGTEESRFLLAINNVGLVAPMMEFSPKTIAQPANSHMTRDEYIHFIYSGVTRRLTGMEKRVWLEHLLGQNF